MRTADDMDGYGMDVSEYVERQHNDDWQPQDDFEGEYE